MSIKWAKRWKDAAAGFRQAGGLLSSCQLQGSPALLHCDVAQKEAGLSALPDMQTHEGNDQHTASPSLFLAACQPLSHPTFRFPCDIPLSVSAGLALFLPLSCVLLQFLPSFTWWLILSLLLFHPSLPPVHLLYLHHIHIVSPGTVSPYSVTLFTAWFKHLEASLN